MEETPREDRSEVTRRGALYIGAAVGAGGLGGWLAASGNRPSGVADQRPASVLGGNVTDGQQFIGGRVTPAGAVVNHGGDRYLDRTGGVLPDSPVGDPRFVCLSRGPLNVRDLGAVGDGVTDDSEAFRLAYRVAVDRQESGFDGLDRVGRTRIQIPEGRFLLTEPDAMMAATGGPRCAGLRFEGAGANITEVVFAPSAANARLLSNDDVWRAVSWSGITFIGTASTHTWMDSVSHGGAQHYSFSDVTWQGSWGAGIRLAGTNNNSEFVWDRCGVHGDWTDGFLCIGTRTGDDAGDQDQFLNYWFNDCRVEFRRGYFVNAPYGGSISCRDGSYILTEAGTFFHLPQGDHAAGVQRLRVDGVRFETRRPECRIIDSAWKGGIVEFTNCDNSVESHFGMETAVRAHFRSLNDSMPVILWQNCALEGRHKYSYAVDSWRAAPRVKYDSCSIEQHADAHDFLVHDSLDGMNAGGTPPVVFENCRGSTSRGDTLSEVRFDCVVGWQLGKSGSPRRHAARFSSAQGDALPRQDDEDGFLVILPLFSVVTSFRIYKPAGLGTSAAMGVIYMLSTEEDPATVLATVTAPPDTPWVDWAVQREAVVAPMTLDNDRKRRLRLTAVNADQRGGPLSFAVLEYLA